MLIHMIHDPTDNSMDFLLNNTVFLVPGITASMCKSVYSCVVVQAFVSCTATHEKRACGDSVCHADQLPQHDHACATMQGPSFETPGQQQGGRVLSWIQRMLTAANPTSASASSASVGPAKSLVAQTALLHLLSTNVELFGVCVDQCYASQAPVSRAYFQVFCSCKCPTACCIQSLCVFSMRN